MATTPSEQGFCVFHLARESNCVRQQMQIRFDRRSWQHVCLLFTWCLWYKRHSVTWLRGWDISRDPRKPVFAKFIVKMSEPEFNYDPENKVDQKHGYYIFFASIIGFGLLNWIVGRFGPPKIVKGDDWRWNNLFISWVHAAIVGTWDILW